MASATPSSRRPAQRATKSKVGLSIDMSAVTHKFGAGSAVQKAIGSTPRRANTLRGDEQRDSARGWHDRAAASSSTDHLSPPTASLSLSPSPEPLKRSPSLASFFRSRSSGRTKTRAAAATFTTTPPVALAAKQHPSSQPGFEHHWEVKTPAIDFDRYGNIIEFDPRKRWTASKSPSPTPTPTPLLSPFVEAQSTRLKGGDRGRLLDENEARRITIDPSRQRDLPPTPEEASVDDSGQAHDSPAVLVFSFADVDQERKASIVRVFDDGPDATRFSTLDIEDQLNRAEAERF